MVEFLLVLMVAEHIQIGIKALISFFLGNAPPMVSQGLMERKKLLTKFEKTDRKKTKLERAATQDEPMTAV